MGQELFQPSREGLRGLALYLMGDYGGAGRAYRAGLEGPVGVDPEDDPAGFEALRSGDLAEAERRATASLAGEPDDPEARVTLAEIAFERGDMAGAGAQLRRALTEAPTTSMPSTSRPS